MKAQHPATKRPSEEQIETWDDEGGAPPDGPKPPFDPKPVADEEPAGTDNRD